MISNQTHKMKMKKQKKICRVILPWGIYEYTCLPIRLNISSNIMQQKMYQLFRGMKKVVVNMDETIIISINSFEKN